MDLCWKTTVRKGFVHGALLVCFWSPAGVAQMSSPEPLVQQARIDLPGAAEWYRRILLSADGRTLLIPAPLADCSAGTRCGAVEVYSRGFGVWPLEARLTAADGASLDLFGGSLALSANGDTVLVGASFKDCAAGPDCGAAYVYTREAGGTWSQQQKLVPSDAGALRSFGSGVALSSDGATALVGAFGTPCDNGFVGCGVVYVFARSGDFWIETGKITLPFTSAGEGFGSTVALSGNGQIALIAANRFGIVPGSVYVFRQSGGSWIQEARIDAPPDAVLFGEEMELSDDGGTAVISAPPNDFCAGGRTWVYTRQGGAWPLQSELVPGEGFASGFAGLSGDGSEAIVGVRKNPCVEEQAPLIAAVFTRSGEAWTETQKLYPQDLTVSGGSPGVDLSADGDVAAVGPLPACSGFLGPDCTGFGRRVVLVFGAPQLISEIPALGGPGLLVLALALAACGAAFLARS